MNSSKERVPVLINRIVIGYCDRLSSDLVGTPSVEDTNSVDKSDIAMSTDLITKFWAL